MNYQNVTDQMDASSGNVDQTTVILYADDGSISYLNVWSRMWQTYQEWIAQGNTPLPPA
jgi:hypothetical protein